MFNFTWKCIAIKWANPVILNCTLVTQSSSTSEKAASLGNKRLKALRSFQRLTSSGRCVWDANNSDKTPASLPMKTNRFLTPINAIMHTSRKGNWSQKRTYPCTALREFRVYGGEKTNDRRRHSHLHWRHFQHHIRRVCCRVYAHFDPYVHRLEYLEERRPSFFSNCDRDIFGLPEIVQTGSVLNKVQLFTIFNQCPCLVEKPLRKQKNISIAES